MRWRDATRAPRGARAGERASGAQAGAGGRGPAGADADGRGRAGRMRARSREKPGVSKKGLVRRFGQIVR